MKERPDGSQASAIGWMLIIVGIFFAAFITNNAETTESGVILLLIANLGIGLGIILVSLGYLVRAIWFLPGREDQITQEDVRQTTEQSGEDFHFCDWCHLGLYAPDIACSRQAEGDIREELENGVIPREACRNELTKRGLLGQ